MNWKKEYEEKIYAGVLGKMLGVYLGRPVEGWKYEAIRDSFDLVGYYVNDQLKVPLIVADDDLSGTFAFFRAMEDNHGQSKITAKEIGDTWLNYIIENRSILWWGGLGNSAEHSAYLMLKNGIEAPESGSKARLGEVLSQQIGAQIFMDAYAMMCPGDPEKAVYYVEQCARVSNDGFAVDAACFLGAMEAAAFAERDLNKLFDDCQRFIKTTQIQRLVDQVREYCRPGMDFRTAHHWLEQHYGYQNFAGPCPMLSNHAMVLACLLLAGDDFHQSVTYAASAGWDTDCNAGNVGCLNAIRLGLDALAQGPDLRSPVADRMYVVTSDGGEGITDAVRETRRIVAAAKALRGIPGSGQPDSRYGFEAKGSVQGFALCPVANRLPVTGKIENANRTMAMNGLKVSFNGLTEFTPLCISTAVFLDPSEAYTNYETFVSPTLYSGQTVSAKIYSPGEQQVGVKMYVAYVDAGGDTRFCYSSAFWLGQGDHLLEWEIPDLGGMSVYRFGFRFTDKKRNDHFVVIRQIDWSNTPRRFEQQGILMKDMWDANPYWARAFVSSAELFAPNLNYTYYISHQSGTGLATIGTRDFTDYAVTSVLKFSIHQKGGLVARSKGHRRYYAAVLVQGQQVQIIKRRDAQETVLAQAKYNYEQFQEQKLTFEVIGNKLTVYLDGAVLLTGQDTQEPYLNGGAGYLIDSGTMFIDGFLLEGK